MQPNHINFIGLGAMNVTTPYKFIPVGGSGPAWCANVGLGACKYAYQTASGSGARLAALGHTSTQNDPRSPKPSWIPREVSRTTAPRIDVAKPSEFIGFGAMAVTKPYKFIGFGAMDVATLYKIMVFGAMGVTNSYT